MPLHRRHLLCGPTAMALLTALGAESASAQKEVIQSKEQWMDAWLQDRAKHHKGLSKGALEVRKFADPVYILMKQIRWTPNPGQVAEPVTVPRGFVTDLASVPWPFWSAIRPDGLVAYAAIFHDYLYWTQSVDRETADMIFKYAMQDFRISTITVTAVYQAVRLGGESYWKENARLKRSGEKRVLKIMPDDPTVRWIDWKAKPSVFL